MSFAALNSFILNDIILDAWTVRVLRCTRNDCESQIYTMNSVRHGRCGPRSEGAHTNVQLSALNWRIRRSKELLGNSARGAQLP